MEQILKCTLLFILLVLGTSVVIAQKSDQAEEYYQKTKKAMHELCGEEYVLMKTRIFYRKRKPNDLALLDTAQVLADKALELTNESESERIAELSIILGDINATKMEFPKAVPYYLRSVEIYEELGKKRELAIMQYQLGTMYSNMGNPDDAINMLMESHAYFQSKKDSVLLAKLEFRIGGVHWRLQKESEAMSHIERGLDLARKVKDTIQIISAFRGLAAIYSYKAGLEREIDNQKFMQYYQQAVEYVVQARDLCREIDSQADLPGILVSLAVCYKHMGKNDLALDYAKLALSQSQTLNNPFSECRSLSEIAQIKVNLREYAEAESYAIKACEKAEEIGNLRLMKRAYQSGSVVYEAAGDYKKALEYYNKEMSVYRRILNDKNLEDLANARLKYEKNRAEVDKRLAETELRSKTKILDLTHELNEQANYRVLALTIGIVFVVLLLVAGWIVYRLRMAGNALKEKETEVVYLKEKRRLESDLQSKEQETLDMASLLSFRNEFTQKIVDDIGDILRKQEANQMKSSLVELKFELIQHLKSTHEMDIISGSIEALQHEFYEKIKAVNPDVTKKEFLISSLIKLGIETKEMARILGVSDKSIRMYKYRLKKKLALDEEVDLRTFLQEL